MPKGRAPICEACEADPDHDPDECEDPDECGCLKCQRARENDDD